MIELFKSESPLLLFSLLVISLCQIAITVILLRVSQDLRQMFRQLNQTLPRWNHLLQEAGHTLGTAQRILERSNKVMGRVEGVLTQACDTVSEALQKLFFLKEKAQTFLVGRFGNGAGGRTRRQQKGRWTS